jgi:hypothetical protein
LPEPFSILAAFLISTVAGGVFMMKVKLLSAKAVITTGSGRPGSSLCVWRVERLAELHDVQAALAQRRADRGRGVRLARRHLQLDEADDLLRHDWLLIRVRNLPGFAGSSPTQP